MINGLAQVPKSVISPHDLRCEICAVAHIKSNSLAVIGFLAVDVVSHDTKFIPNCNISTLRNASSIVSFSNLFTERTFISDNNTGCLILKKNTLPVKFLPLCN